MATSKVEYLGGLRTKATHLKSGTEIFTDAPVDNNGKGEAFSPTDLVATSYASCVLTIIGIYCANNDLSFENGHAEITKLMGVDPRRISKLEINLDLSNNGWDENAQERVRKAGEACPVSNSVDPLMEIEFKYQF
ncbi:MAG: OsmC family protein [Crocinitomicaceae bacterium]|nr:OsmC family protein [Crocinitomicaceae bacterium]